MHIQNVDKVKLGNMVDIVILTKFRIFPEAIYEEKQEFREILHKT